MYHEIMDASYQLTAGINNKQEKYVQTRGIHAKQAKRHSQENITHTPQSKYQRPKSFGEFKKSKDSEGLWFKWQLEYIHPGGWRKSGCTCLHQGVGQISAVTAATSHLLKCLCWRALRLLYKFEDCWIPLGGKLLENGFGPLPVHSLHPPARG